MLIQDKTHLLTLKKLRQDWFRIAALSTIFFGISFCFLEIFWSPVYALRWLGLASAFGAWQLYQLWGWLPENHRKDEQALLPTLGLGNFLSFLRGIFIAALLGFMFSPWAEGRLAWLPALLYFFATLSDFADGYLARITNHVTELGTKLDMSNDAWGVLVVTFLAFWYGQVPVWYLLVGLARYIFVAALWLREKQGKQTLEMPPAVWRRIFAGVQMGFIVAMLVPILTPPATTITATLFMIPFLGGFIYDWLGMTQTISQETLARFFAQFSKPFYTNWLPLSLRFFSVGTIFYTVFVLFPRYAPPFTSLFQMLVVLLAALLTAGIAVRAAAFLLLVYVGLALNFLPFSFAFFLLLSLATMLLFIGAGKFSLWSPEDWLIYKRAGEKAI